MVATQGVALRNVWLRGGRDVVVGLSLMMVAVGINARPAISQEPEPKPAPVAEAAVPLPPEAKAPEAAPPEAAPAATGWREIRTFDDRYAKLTREQRTALSNLVIQIKKTGKAPDAGTDDAKMFDLHINWRLGKLTLVENLTLAAKPPDASTGLARLRREMRTELRTLGLYEDTSAHDQINAKALTFLRAVAFNSNFKGEPLPPPLFHPAVRANAMVVIGFLNERETSAMQKVAVPYSDALGVTLDALDPIKTKNVSGADLIAASALPGILRHAEAGVGETHRARMVGLLAGVVGAKQPPAGRSAEGHMWLRRRSADVLGAMAAANSTAHEPRVVQALAGLLGERTEGLAPEFLLAQHGDAALALGQFDLSTIPGTNTRQPAEAVAVHVAEVVATPPASVQFIKHYLQPAKVALSGPFSGPGVSVEQTKKRGLAAAVAAAPDSKDKAFVLELQKRIDELWTIVDAKDFKDYDVPTKIGPKAKEFQQWLAKVAPQALEPATKPADDGKLPTSDEPKTIAAPRAIAAPPRK